MKHERTTSLRARIFQTVKRLLIFFKFQHFTKYFVVRAGYFNEKLVNVTTLRRKFHKKVNKNYWYEF